MNYKILIFLTIILSISFSVIGKNYSITGTLSDECHQKIAGVKIDIVSQTGFVKRLIADANGEFRIDSLESNKYYRLRFSKSRFFGNEIRIQLKSDTSIHVELNYIPISIDPLPVICFDYEDFEVKPNYKDSLIGLISVLKQNSTIIVGIVTFRDSSEVIDLSENRANSVLNLLISFGIDSNRLVIERSIVPNKLKTGEAIYDCLSKQYIEEGVMLTEKYLSSLPERKQDEMRNLNRCICFRVVSD